MGYTGQSINMSADKGHQKLLPDGLEQLDNYRNYPKFLSYVLENRPKLIGKYPMVDPGLFYNFFTLAIYISSCPFGPNTFVAIN